VVSVVRKVRAGRAAKRVALEAELEKGTATDTSA
jgi:hypothetical protein